MVSPSAQPPSRYRRRILGVGALLTGALYVIGAPIYNGRIEADLDQRVPAELEDAGYDGVKASFSGQDGTLTCRAPLDDPERARAAAYEVWGVHAIELDRSCRVNTVSTAAVDDTTPGEASDEATATGSVDESRESIPTTVPPPPTTVESDLATVNDIVAANPDLAFLAVLLSDADIGRTRRPRHALRAEQRSLRRNACRRARAIAERLGAARTVAEPSRRRRDHPKRRPGRGVS